MRPFGLQDGLGLEEDARWWAGGKGNGFGWEWLVVDAGSGDVDELCHWGNNSKEHSEGDAVANQELVL